jgi:hypothetical protein
MFLLEDESTKAEKPATRLTRTTTRFPAACAPAGNRGSRHSLSGAPSHFVPEVSARVSPLLRRLYRQDWCRT